MTPTVGRIVHFICDATTATALSKLGNAVTVGDHVAALVVRVWGSTPDCCVNLQVFADGNGSVWVTSALGDKTQKAERSYHDPRETVV
jgi:hypothetical protein